MIRPATNGDVPRIVELGSLSLKGGPYEKLIADKPEYTRQLALKIIHGAGKILLWDENGEIVGLLGFLVIPHPFSGEITATEIMWFVLEEHRKTGAGIQLLWAAEKMAKELGAKKFQFAAPSAEVGKIYERFGWHQVETTYLKELS